jgi:hypothetical protein
MVGMSEIQKIPESGGFDCRICRALSGLVSVSSLQSVPSLQTKSDVLKVQKSTLAAFVA